MSEKHESHEEHEGPVHQAPWVFFLTVAVAYAVLTVIMLAKLAAGDVEVAELAKLYGVEAGLLAVFITFFGSMLYFVNKLVGAVGGDE